MKRWQQLVLALVLVAAALVMMQKVTDQIEERRAGGQPVPAPGEAVEGRAAEAFFEAALGRRDRAAAERWVADPEAPWFRSQLGFLAGAESLDYAARDRQATIRRLVVGGEEYSGEMVVHLDAAGRKVVHATLRLERADGAVISM